MWLRRRHNGDGIRWSGRKVIVPFKYGAWYNVIKLSCYVGVCFVRVCVCVRERES